MPENKIDFQRHSKLLSLLNVRKLGFYPKVIIDVGALTGTYELYESFDGK